MKTKGLVLFLLALLPLLTISPVYGARPIVSSGTVTLVGSVMVSSRTAGDNTIVMLMQTFKVTGALTGTSTGMERDVINGKTGSVTFHGVSSFTGTVNGKTGTLMIGYVGHSDGTTIRGHFVILSGTGDLKGLRAEGSFSGPVMAPLSYSIRWHFGPAMASK